jgi:hypothetical protein
MGDDARAVMKAACIQAAATLLADQLALAQRAKPGAKPAADTAACARYARDLFMKVTGEVWK